MTSLVISILLLGFLVFIHELGHFMAAKASGMSVEKFSIGMGPTVAGVERGGTEYVFALFPIGGFVSVAGAGDDPDEMDDPRRYPNRPLTHRAIFAAAGPFMNFFFAILLLMGTFMWIGVDVPKNELTSVIGEVSAKSPAAAAGLKEGDRIVEVNGVAIERWPEITEVLDQSKGAPVHMTVERKGKTIEKTVHPRWNKKQGRYMMGVSSRVEFEKQKVSAKEAGQLSLAATGRMSTLILDAVGNLVTGKTAVNDKDEGLSGPVGIVHAIDRSASQGAGPLIMLMAALSINLGLLNLLPIPALDGSRLLFILLEAVRGRPVSQEKEGIVNFVGFAFLMGLMIYVTYNDIYALVTR